MVWTLELWTLGLWTNGQLDPWILDDWMLGLWTLGAWKFFPVFVTSTSFFMLVNVEFLIISSSLWLMYYGPVERAANDCYNSNLLQLVLQFKFPINTTNSLKTQLLYEE